MIRCPTCNRPKDTCPGRACFDARERERLSDVERAVLARDVADVQHALDDDDEDRRLSKWEASVCEAWLTRARAALS